jgi:hypothetical protein
MDVDGNGEITEADRTIIGNPIRLHGHQQFYL